MIEIGQFTHPGIVAVYDLLNAYEQGTQPAFYRRLARSIGDAIRIIDLGCGSGLISSVLAADGHEVIGVEPSSAMLGLARGKYGEGHISWVLGGYEAIESWDADLAIMSGHVAQFFIDDDEWAQALLAIRRGLRKGGKLSFESRNPDAGEWARWGQVRRRVTDPECGIVEHRTEVQDMTNGVLAYEMYFTFIDRDEELLVSDRLRFRGSAELTRSLVDAGFTVETTFGDWERNPVSPDRPEIILVARRRELRE